MEDKLPFSLGNNVKKTVYQEPYKKHHSFYYQLWGKHYYQAYYRPVTVKTITGFSDNEELTTVQQMPKFHALILKNQTGDLYMLRPLGGMTSFLESDFFRKVYNKDSFKETYIGDFMKESFTIVHPYLFLTSNKLAKESGLESGSARLFYIPKNHTADTLTDGTQVQDKLVSLTDLPDFKSHTVLTNINQLLDSIHSGYNHEVDIRLYIRTRLFDMLVGDWNKIPENWNWIGENRNDSIFYKPYVLDRNHAFTKVDGILFRQLLSMLGIGFITDYGSHLKNVKKFNTLGYGLDVALTSRTNENIWLEEANSLKNKLTDVVIDNAFLQLPEELRSHDTEQIKINLKKRRENIEYIAHEYFVALQKTPSITGTTQTDKFIVENDENNNTRVRIINKQDNITVFDKIYNPQETEEIWLYGLGGNDTFEVDKTTQKIPVLLIGGKGKNTYNIKNGKAVSIYEYKSQIENVENIENAKVIIPNNDSALFYNYSKLRHSEFSITPIGIYDSDLGLDLGTSFTYTIYGFRRSPYTRRHQISINYSNGITYQGIFPDYNQKRSFHLMMFVGSPAYFSNFFGFGNDTEGHKDKQKKYNRVHINRYSVTPGFYYEFDKKHIINISASADLFNVSNPEGRNRYINEVYPDNDPVFDARIYLDLSAGYEINRKFNGFISSAQFAATTGWVINTFNTHKNFPYISGSTGINLRITDRITFATLFKAKALFNNKYEFFQSATTELRGFRNNHFIGKQSFYQYNDLRLDMGRLKNPFTPLKYGVFIGFDQGRVWYPFEDSKKWHTSYGGGWWITLFRNFTGKFSYFGSTDTGRFKFELGLGF